MPRQRCSGMIYVKFRPSAGASFWLDPTGTGRLLMSYVRAVILTLTLVLPAASTTALAQSAPPPAPSAPAQPPADQSLKPEQLDQLMAPIALYPDALLANVMMAS